MITNGQDTKLKIADAAISLFMSQGYKGTTIRQIAGKANVNIALVSYHFGGKKGLLEELITSFYEGYIRKIEIIYHTSSASTVKGTLLEISECLLKYQQKHTNLARFVHREMTLDSTLIRELMATYLAKEKYFLQTLFEKGMKRKEFKKQPLNLLSIQFKDMMLLPFLHPLYLTEVYHMAVNEPRFMKEYQKWVEEWLQKCVCLPEKKSIFTAMPSPLFSNVQEKWGG